MKGLTHTSVHAPRTYDLPSGLAGPGVSNCIFLQQLYATQKKRSTEPHFPDLCPQQDLLFTVIGGLCVSFAQSLGRSVPKSYGLFYPYAPRRSPCPCLRSAGFVLLSLSMAHPISMNWRRSICLSRLSETPVRFSSSSFLVIFLFLPC